MRTTITHVTPPSTRAPSMTVQSAQREDLAIVSVTGEIDLLTSPQLTEAVTAALTDKPRGLIIDLTDTAFLSSAGMGVLVAAHATAPTGSFSVVADGPATSRPMELIGLNDFLDLHPTLDDAVAAFDDVLEVSA